jgi:hypothetical protein
MNPFTGTIAKPDMVEDTEVPVMSYDEPGIMECEIDDVRYRIDSGRQGTALALSSCPGGSWDWAFVAELQWDGHDFKCKEVGFETRRELATKFKQALEDMS